MTTAYHSQYWAHALTLRGATGPIEALSRLAALLKDKLEAQKTLKSLEGERNRKRRELFDAQDAIDGQRDELIKRIEGQLHQTHAVKTIFLFRWRLG